MRFKEGYYVFTMVYDIEFFFDVKWKLKSSVNVYFSIDE